MTSGRGARFAGWFAGGMAGAFVFALLPLVSPVIAGATDVRVLTTADGLPSNWVTAIAPAPDGKLWVGTGNAGVYLLDPASGKGRGYRVADGLSSDEVVSIAQAGGKVYVGTAGGLSVFDGTSWSRIDKIENVTMRNVRVAASPGGKELWASSVYLAGGAVRFDGKRWEFLGGKGRGLFNDVQGFAFLPDGVLMGSGSGVPYLRMMGGEVKVVAEGLPPCNIFSVAAAGETLFLGTSRGLFRHDGEWKEVPFPAGFTGTPVFAVAVAGGAVIAGSDKGLVITESGQARTITREGGLPASRITSVAIAGDLLAAGTARGLALVKRW